jgi:hypothetical protein
MGQRQKGRGDEMSIPRFLLTILATLVFVAGAVLLAITVVELRNDDLVALAVVCILGSILAIAHMEV